jgi:acyl carrier protein
MDNLYRTVAEALEVPPGALTEESSQETVPTWDSLSHLNLVMALEGEFGVRLSLDDAVSIRSVALIRSTLRRYGVEV